MHHGVSEQAKARRHRRDDAQALFDSGRWRGSMYLAGYAVECLLKTKLMQMFGCYNLPELEDELQRRGLLPGHITVFTHQLELLLGLTRSTDRLRNDRALWQQFNLVNRWVPAWRYSPDLSNREDAEDFIEAVDRILHWIDHNV